MPLPKHGAQKDAPSAGIPDTTQTRLFAPPQDRCRHTRDCARLAKTATRYSNTKSISTNST